MIAATTTRVPEHTPPQLNERIRRQTEHNVARAISQGPEAIDRRLAELDQEWDIERTLELNASTLALAGMSLALLHDRRWLFLPMAVMGFLAQHAVQGWCPPIRLFRRLGMRTESEIAEERYALKLWRGDFREVPSPDATDRLEEMMEAVRR